MCDEKQKCYTQCLEQNLCQLLYTLKNNWSSVFVFNIESTINGDFSLTNGKIQVHTDRLSPRVFHKQVHLILGV